MLEPDTRDWSFVLDRPCPECGFDAHSCSLDTVPGLIRENATLWQSQLSRGSIRPGRPDATRWSSLEYACHVRDVIGRIAGRVELMLACEDPVYPVWDQDAAAVQDRYEEQDPAAVVAELASAAEGLADMLDNLSESAWSRPGRRDDGASFTVATISVYMIHESVHHLFDLAAFDT